jgi:hypothetical protein
MRASLPAPAQISPAHVADTHPCTAPPPPAARFLPLSTGLAASLALQAWALWQGQAAGVNVNGDDMLWALQYWSVMLGALLAPVLLARMDWASIGQLAFRAADVVARGIQAVVGTFYYNWSWAEGTRR